MRSLVLSLILGLGAFGLTLSTPSQVRADDFRGPAFERGYTTPVAYHWRGGSHYRYGRAFYPGWGGYYGRGHGYYGGYYGGYPYGGWGYRNNYYAPGIYGGGYAPWGYPYGGFGSYYAPGYFW